MTFNTKLLRVIAFVMFLASCGESETSPTGLSADIAASPDAGESDLNVANLSPETQAEEQETEPLSPVERRPVQIGHDGPDFDACAGIGRVANLNARGDNFLSVRERPDAGSAELDRLNPDETVRMCDAADNGWLGIVYDASGTAGRCGVSSPVEEVQDYDGVCRSGWVSPRYIELIAG